MVSVKYFNSSGTHFGSLSHYIKRIMSSPLPKASDKQRKMKATPKATTNNLDTRTELAELVKRKAEISVSCSTVDLKYSFWWFHWSRSCTLALNPDFNFWSVGCFLGNASQSWASDLCFWRFIPGRYSTLRQYNSWMGPIFSVKQKYYIESGQT